MEKRGSGILLHLTSLPSAFGIGDFGPWAYRFVDFLARCKQSYWQCLPLNPTNTESGNSPYHSTSAFALNPLLISPELLVQEGFLSKEDLEPFPAFPVDKVDYSESTTYKERLFSRAFELFSACGASSDYCPFCERNRAWLEPFALFTALKAQYAGKPWYEWPEEERNAGSALPKARQGRLSAHMEKVRFLQYISFRQWTNLKAYCNRKGIRIFGDMPIYVVHDSAEVWRRPEIFNLDVLTKQPLTVAGVPPDYFSKTGQLWGNPVYRWDVLKREGYTWWINRIAHNLGLFDLVRLDHFRGFVEYWEVPAGEKDAVNGRWVAAPAMDFFNELTKTFPNLPLIAEDLGTITPDVWELLEHFKIPGMKVLLFAFGSDLAKNLYAPHNLTERSVVYTGTHDNNTVRGWFEREAAPEDKTRLSRYLGKDLSAENVHREMIRLAMMSVSRIAIFPLQDVLGLGEEARMNLPASNHGNWKWRLTPQYLTLSAIEELSDMTELYGRWL
ncbi:MAG: 4-alpha-glucanotransferase [Deltaproteobacteria bacterium]|nr:4-alpha-glucanotransferase [Deltaproteobacteria bacterium]